MPVILLPRAEQDINDVLVSIGPSGTWLARLRKVLASLDTHPERFARAEEGDDLGIEFREVLLGKRRNTYRILFTINGSTVFVHHIRRAIRGPVQRKDLTGHLKTRGEAGAGGP